MKPSGPIPANLMIVGEAPGKEEERMGMPFVGASGHLLDRTLHEVGLLRSTSFVTNVCRHRPPDNDISLWMSDNKTCPHEGWQRIAGKWVHPNIAAGLELLGKEIELVQPRLILALGNTPLWALTGNNGVMKWRGSRLSPTHIPAQVVPALHPAAVLRQMELLPILRMDLTRVKNILEGKQLPRNYDFRVAPTFEEVCRDLRHLLTIAAFTDLDVAVDIETRGGHITCIGFAWTVDAAICIPLLTSHPDKPFYFSVEEEAVIQSLIRQIFLHPRITCVGQNFLYDCQYFERWWHITPRAVRDTMIGHHSLYSTLRKGLDFLSSMYCQDHVYWKDESKDWDPKVGEKQLWTYNCKDAVTTWEVDREILKERDKLGSTGGGILAHFAFQQSLFFPVLRMMNRGIRIDHGRRSTLRKELLAAALSRQDHLNYLVGHPLNPKSPKKVMEFFYNDMKIPGAKSLATGKNSSDANALNSIVLREPLLRPVVQAILELRSIGTFLSTFIEAELDVDGRMRTAFGIAGTHSYRFNSSENAFGSGHNFQNIPVKEKQKLTAAKDYISLPNVRSLYLPDPGYTFFDMDLDRADLQVVVWEAEDPDLKYALRAGLDMHLFNAAQIWNLSAPVDELSESHPNYPEWKAKYAKQRQLAKAGVHATDYGVGDRKLAITLGITILESERFRKRWFSAHPGILRWHKRTEEQARARGYVENRFGARLYVLGRLNLPELLAWTPQSTVAGVINRILVAVDSSKESGESAIELLLQVHDSLGGQFPTSTTEASLSTLRELSRISVPYDDPLVIPVGIKTSELSWGDCK